MYYKITRFIKFQNVWNLEEIDTDDHIEIERQVENIFLEDEPAASI